MYLYAIKNFKLDADMVVTVGRHCLKILQHLFFTLSLSMGTRLTIPKSWTTSCGLNTMKNCNYDFLLQMYDSKVI